ncbi:dipeptidase [Muricauda ruestringensis]|uniref:Dipeptidase n=1 Tax=Flagellimonas aurea TaxID=2915619 RepID=A0ABS3G5E8_9FLAO|nr:membrane dipeptidase [Allomuricauda aurea]MAO16970.1 peptidase M19 [Allomuricauda sp.]MBO0354279.1 dipeptidase [Allomuricauda aurea]|tara:strand:+ start:275 stop:1339 length:1065 start_codon:yes stop_codon:yes gene_type:complete
MFIFDAHLDLSMNAMEWNRDLTLPVAEIREREQGMTDKPDRGKNTVSLPAMREGNIGLCMATQIARFVKKGSSLPGWHSQHQAWAQTQGQLAWYKTMEAAGEMVQIKDIDGLESHLKLWKSDMPKKPVGYILSLEGADSIVDLSYLEKSYESGLRAIGPAHYGPGIYAHGTDSVGGIGQKGKDLLKKVEELNIILDATHLCDKSFWETMDVYNGPVWASHNNCRELVDHNRQFSDEQIKELISRDAVIGVALDAWMMVPNWVRGKSTPKEMNVTLEIAVDNIDHICQLAGNTDHVGIGTDLDGAFGKEQSPYDLDTIADLQKIPDLLTKRGYTSSGIEKIMNQNFINFLKKVWS